MLPTLNENNFGVDKECERMFGSWYFCFIHSCLRLWKSLPYTTATYKTEDSYMPAVTEEIARHFEIGSFSRFDDFCILIAFA